MAKYNWQELEQEYILSDYKSVSSFLKDKKIPNNGSTRKQTSGWGDKKRQKQDKSKTKTIQKVIEKESTKEANNISTVNRVAKNLLSKIERFDDVNEKNIKTLTSALKDINDIVTSNFGGIENNTFAKEVERAWQKRNE